MLVISDAGLNAIDDAPTEESRKKQAATKVRANKPRADQKTAASEPQRNKSAPAAVRPGTKQALLIDLLKRETGATIGEIVEATGWQAHSVRGAISGTLKKKLGFTVSSEALKDRGRVYRITGTA